MTRLRAFAAACGGGTFFELARIISVVSVVAATGLQQVATDLRANLDRAAQTMAGNAPTA